jgi:GNAT superfamily N-acetyltransferase
MSVETVVLPGGLQILVRPVGPGDKDAIAKAFERLSPRSRYRRFFSPMTRLSQRDLDYLTEIDHTDHEALAAIRPDTGELIGVARYVRTTEAAEAEVSVVVGDPWQRRGIATALLDRLVERAREAGVEHFLAVVLSENTEALELFEHLSPDSPAPRRNEAGHLEMLIELPEPGEVSESRLGRVLQTVARTAITVNPYRVMLDRIRQLAGDK